MLEKIEKKVVVSKFKQKWTLQGRFLYFHLALADNSVLQAAIAKSVFDATSSSLNGWLSGGRNFIAKRLEQASLYIAQNSTEVDSKAEFIEAYEFFTAADSTGRLLLTPQSIANMPSLARSFLRDVEYLNPDNEPTKALMDWQNRRSFELLGKTKGKGSPITTEKLKGYIEREKEFSEAKQLILDKGNESAEEISFLVGPPGFGKTTIAKALFHDLSLNDHFKDRMIWVEGPRDFDSPPHQLLHQCTFCLSLDQRPSRSQNLVQARKELISSSKGRSVLIFLDDAWFAHQVEAFRNLPKNFSIMVTTRQKDLVSSSEQVVQVEEMTKREAVSVLRSGIDLSGCPESKTADVEALLGQLANRLGHWVQLLSLANAWIKRSTRNGISASQSIQSYLRHFKDALEEESTFVSDLGKQPIQRAKSINACLQVTLDHLDNNSNFAALLLSSYRLSEGIPIQFAELALARGLETSPLNAAASIHSLCDASILAITDDQVSNIRMHPNIHESLSALCSMETTKRSNTVACDIIEEHYKPFEAVTANTKFALKNFLFHLDKANKHSELLDHCYSLQFLKNFLGVLHLNDLVSELSQLSHINGIDEIYRTLRASRTALQRDPSRLALQVYGYLSDYQNSNERISSLVSAATSDIFFHPIPIQPHLNMPKRGEIEIRLFDFAVVGVEVCPKGEKLVVFGGDRVARVYSVKTGNLLFELANFGVLTRNIYLVCKIKFTSQSSELVSVTLGRSTFKIHDANSGEEVRKLSYSKSNIVSVDVSSQGSMLVVAHEDGQIFLVRTADWSVLQSTFIMDETIKTAVFSPDDRLLAIVFAEGSVFVISTEKLAAISSFKLTGRLKALKFVSDWQRLLVVTDKPGESAIYDTQSGKMDRTFDELLLHKASFVDVAEDYSYFAFAPYGKSACKIVDLEKTKLPVKLPESSERTFGTLFLPRQNVVLTLTEDPLVKIWSLETFQKLGSLRGHAGSVTHARKIGPNGRVLTASKDGVVRIFNAVSAIQRPSYEKINPIFKMRFSKDGKRLASLDSFGRIKVWDPFSKNSFLDCDIKVKDAVDLEISNCGEFVLVSHDAKNVTVTSAKTGESVYEQSSGLIGIHRCKFVGTKPFQFLSTHVLRNTIHVRFFGEGFAPKSWTKSESGEIARSLVLLAASKQAAFVDLHGKAHVCSALDGKIIYTLPQRFKYYSRVDTSPDERFISLQGGNGRIVLWDLNKQEFSGDEFMSGAGLDSIEFSVNSDDLFSSHGQCLKFWRTGCSNVNSQIFFDKWETAGSLSRDYAAVGFEDGVVSFFSLTRGALNSIR